MQIVTMVVSEETFTFTPPTGDPIHIWSGQLRQWLLDNARAKAGDVQFPEETLEQVVVNHGVELPRLETMTLVEALEPVIIAETQGGTHILVDGAHRRAYWVRHGVHVQRGWIVPEQIWRAFTLNPAELKNAYHAPDGAMLPQRRR